jgi:hypothetical protein
LSQAAEKGCRYCASLIPSVSIHAQEDLAAARRIEQGREQAVEEGEYQAICRFQSGSGQCSPFKNDELLPEIDDFSFALGPRDVSVR